MSTQLDTDHHCQRRRVKEDLPDALTATGTFTDVSEWSET